MHKGAKESMLQAWLAQLHDLARPAWPFLRSRPISTAAVSLGSQVVAQLLEVAPQALATALTTRTMSTNRGSSYSIPLRPSEAEDARDALATSAYSALLISPPRDGAGPSPNFHCCRASALLAPQAIKAPDCVSPSIPVG